MIDIILGHFVQFNFDYSIPTSLFFRDCQAGSCARHWSSKIYLPSIGLQPNLRSFRILDCAAGSLIRLAIAFVAFSVRAIASSLTLHLQPAPSNACVSHHCRQLALILRMACGANDATICHEKTLLCFSSNDKWVFHARALCVAIGCKIINRTISDLALALISESNN